MSKVFVLEDSFYDDLNETCATCRTIGIFSSQELAVKAANEYILKEYIRRGSEYVNKPEKDILFEDLTNPNDDGYCYFKNEYGLYGYLNVFVYNLDELNYPFS